MDIKAFYCKFDAPGVEGRDTVVAYNEEEALEILLKRIRKEKRSDLVNAKINEISLDNIRLSSLTAGDLIRLINSGK